MVGPEEDGGLAVLGALDSDLGEARVLSPDGFPSPALHPCVGGDRWPPGSALLPHRMPGELGPKQSTQNPSQQLTDSADPRFPIHPPLGQPQGFLSVSLFLLCR